MVLTSGLHVCNSRDDVFRVEGDVLNTRSSVVLDVFLDLRLLLSGSWFIEWHLDGFVVVSHHDRTERARVGDKSGMFNIKIENHIFTTK